jgi:hypothetical protein
MSSRMRTVLVRLSASYTTMAVDVALGQDLGSVLAHAMPLMDACETCRPGPRQQAQGVR